ncbi:OLC1v1005830C1 [Oldenlandia corymbosa var. corymbosa]|uniref:OLC1v1005830C1 n=1 Tax=Oldenlandia corymbosa var. corymbosa TaxID=529605 RepID=A0AAV1DFG2_OLDCO|nr:OLC1v1005830C1 [Oldenlandia corymbosa var. corymbosa]
MALRKYTRLMPEWDRDKQEKIWKKQSIHKLPARITDLNKNAYQPRVVSFGPYHHGKPNLLAMETHKTRALICFLKRANIDFNSCVDKFTYTGSSLKDAYDALDEKFQGDGADHFMDMMIRDGCFMLEMLLHYCEEKRPSVYTESDPIFGINGKYLVPYIKRDMLMLENQLPMSLLHALLPLAYKEAPKGRGPLVRYMNNLIIKFCCPRNQGMELGECKHILDAYRKSLLLLDPNQPISEDKKDSEQPLLDPSQPTLEKKKDPEPSIRPILSEHARPEQKLKAPQEVQYPTPRPQELVNKFRRPLKSSPFLPDSWRVIDQIPSATKPREGSIGIQQRGTEQLNPPRGHHSLTVIDQIPSAATLREAGPKVQKSKAEKLSPPGQHSLTVIDQIPSATELLEAGIKIQQSKTEKLTDVSFQGGVLRLPPIIVDDMTEPVFQNLIAFEMFHHGIGNEVACYVALMDDIIDSANDVNLLHSQGIIYVNGLGSHETLAKMFNSLTKDVPIDLWSNNPINQVRRDAAQYSRKPWNQWRANLMHTYFKNPWTTLSLIAAFVILVLTVIQTIFTAGQYYQNGN